MGNQPSSSKKGRRSRHEETMTTASDRAKEIGKSISSAINNTKRSFDDDHPASTLIDNVCGPFFSGDDKRGYGADSEDHSDDDSRTLSDDETLDEYDRRRRGKGAPSESSSFVSHTMTDDLTEANASEMDNKKGRRRRDDDSETVDSEDESLRKNRGDASIASSALDGQSTMMSKPLASSFAKRCYFTKSGIGKTTQHYEGLTLTGNVVLMLAAAMKLKGCPTICDEDLRRVEQTYPNQFSRLPDELLLSSGWRRISKYCHFSNKPIPDGIPFFHSKKRLHPQGGFYFLLAAAVGMVRPIDVEPLNRDTLVLLETDYPTQCDAAPQSLIQDPFEWVLVEKFCFFSGGPINTEEDVYYRADFDGNHIYMLAFLSPSLTPEELYRLGPNGEVDEKHALTSVAAVEEVESVYDLTERDFDDLKLYHLGPCRALPPYILQPQAWTKVLPPHFLAARQKALEAAQRYEGSNPAANNAHMMVNTGMGVMMSDSNSPMMQQHNAQQDMMGQANNNGYVDFNRPTGDQPGFNNAGQQQQQQQWQQPLPQGQYNAGPMQTMGSQDMMMPGGVRTISPTPPPQMGMYYPEQVAQYPMQPAIQQAPPPGNANQFAPVIHESPSQTGYQTKFSFYDPNGSQPLGSMQPGGNQYGPDEAKREMEEEGAFISPDAEVPIDEALATRRRSPPGQFGAGNSAQEPKLDPPEDEPPSLTVGLSPQGPTGLQPPESSPEDKGNDVPDDEGKAPSADVQDVEYRTSPLKSGDGRRPNPQKEERPAKSAEVRSVPLKGGRIDRLDKLRGRKSGDASIISDSRSKKNSESSTYEADSHGERSYYEGELQAAESSPSENYSSDMYARRNEDQDGGKEGYYTPSASRNRPSEVEYPSQKEDYYSPDAESQFTEEFSPRSEEEFSPDSRGAPDAYQRGEDYGSYEDELSPPHESYDTMSYGDDIDGHGPVHETESSPSRASRASPTPTHGTDGSASDYTPSLAMRGAQELLRKNRQKRIALASGRKMSRAAQEEASVQSQQIGAPSPRRRDNEGDNEANWDSGTEVTSVVSGSSVWTENTNPADRSSRRALILQMAKARMKSNQKVSGNSSTTSSVTGVSTKQSVAEIRNMSVAEEEQEEEDPAKDDFDLTGDLD